MCKILEKTWFFFLIFLVVVLVLMLYAYKFYDFKTISFSDQPDHWGQFGDYIGGILNPILAFFNIYVLWKLSQNVSEYDKKIHDENIAKQDYILKSGIRHDFLKSIISKFDSFENIFFEYSLNGLSEDEIKISQIKAIKAFRLNLLLFPETYGIIFSCIEFNSIHPIENELEFIQKQIENNTTFELDKYIDSKAKLFSNIISEMKIDFKKEAIIFAQEQVKTER